MKRQKLDAAVWRALWDQKQAETDALKIAVEHGVLDKGHRMDVACADVQLAQDKLDQAQEVMRKFEEEHGIL